MVIFCCSTQTKLPVGKYLPNRARVKPSSIGSLDLYREQFVFPHFSVSLSRPLILLHCLSVFLFGGHGTEGKADIIITNPH